VPLPRDMLLSALLDGKVDFVAAQLTMTPEREQLVAFTNPTRENVNQIVVTGAGTPPIASIADLSGREIFVRGSSPYRQSLVALNQRFLTEKRQAIIIRDAPDDLEDDDLLEMVNAGLIPAIVVDDYIAKFWKQVFKNIVVNQEATVRTDGALAIAVRKSNPQLAAALNTFMSNYGLGTAFGNIVERKYLVKTTYVKSAASEAERRKFLRLVNFFRKYSDRYDMDFLLMAAQGYQESQLNQNAKSAVGAVGIMQLMPATGKQMNVGDVKQAEANIHAGVKYMRHLRDEYYGDEPMDRLNKGLFTFASYNAGPGRIAQLRRETAARGLNPHVWFGNVEQIASERIGRETVTYVSNIYKYYVAYRLVMEDAQRRNAIKERLAKKD
jgi:membrane-bound lytic murein transglycosylase MltF